MSFSRGHPRRVEAYRFRQRLWAERMGAYSALVTALAELRRGTADWYNRRLEDPDSAVELAARVESYRLRGLAVAALSQVRLVASDPVLVEAASEAFDTTRLMRHAQGFADYDARGARASEAIDRFIALAATDVQAEAAVTPGRWQRHGQPGVAAHPTVELGD